MCCTCASLSSWTCCLCAPCAYFAFLLVVSDLPFFALSAFSVGTTVVCWNNFSIKVTDFMEKILSCVLSVLFQCNIHVYPMKNSESYRWSVYKENSTKILFVNVKFHHMTLLASAAMLTMCFSDITLHPEQAYTLYELCRKCIWLTAPAPISSYEIRKVTGIEHKYSEREWWWDSWSICF